MPQFLPHDLVISKTKLNEEFPNSQFLISNCEIKSRRDQNKHGGGLVTGICYKSLISKTITIPFNITRKSFPQS